MCEKILYTHYKDDIDKISKKHKMKILFEQDGATSHTSKSNLFILEKLFPDEGWIQNPPNSPDLAYPIEELWAIIKPRVKRRDPQTIEELKQYLLEEWNAIPKDMIQNLCRNYLKRIEKVLELDGARIEPEYFKKKEKPQYNWEIPEFLPSQRIIYNDKNLRKYKEKEIRMLKRIMKTEKLKQRRRMKSINKKIKSFKKRDLKYLSIGKAISILREREELIAEKNNSKEGKQKIDEEFKKKIEKISKMTVFEYLRHINGDEDKENESDSSTIDEKIEEKIYDLKELIDKNKEIKYRKVY